MFKLINPYMALGALLALVGAFFFGIKVGADREVATAARIEARVRQTEDAAMKAAAAEIAKIEVTNKTVKQVLEREIVEKPVYRDCHNTPDGVRSINSALENRPLPPSDRKLPDADAPSR